MRHRVFELLLILKATRLSSIGSQMLLWTTLGILSTLGIMTGITYNVLQEQTIDEIQKTLTIEAQSLESDLKQVQEFADGFGVSVSEMSRLLPPEQNPSEYYEQLILEFLKNRPTLVTGLGVNQAPFGLIKNQNHFYAYYSVLSDSVKKSWQHQSQQPLGSDLKKQNTYPIELISSNPALSFTVQKRLSPPYFSAYPEIAYPAASSTEQSADRVDPALRQPTDAGSRSRQSSLSNRFTRLPSSWLEPYLWNQDVIATLLQPIQNHTRQTIGTTVLDIDITTLSQRVDRPVIGDDGYFVVLSHEGRILGYPPSPQEAASLTSYRQLPTLEKIWAKIQRSRIGFQTTPAEFLAYRPIDGTNWMMVAVVPRRRLFAPIFQTALGSSLVASLVLLCSVWFFIHRLNQRLKPMITGCRQLVHSSQMALLTSGIAIGTNSIHRDETPDGRELNRHELSDHEFSNHGLRDDQSTENPSGRDGVDPDRSATTVGDSSPSADSSAAGSSPTIADLATPGLLPSFGVLASQPVATDPMLGLDEIDILQDAFQVMYQQLETSLGSLQETLSQLQDTQLQVIQSEKMAAVGQMLAGVAHEINNPISFISGNVEHLGHYIQDLSRIIRGYQSYYPKPPQEFQTVLDDVDPDFLLDDLMQMVRSMRLGSERVREIVRSLRIFSRANDNDFRIADLHEGIDSTLVILNHRLKASSERPEIQILRDYGDLPLVECCLGPLNQVFMNLLSNAIDAIEESQAGWSFDTICENPGIIRIQTRLTETRSIRITIADNGSGIPEHLQSRVFNSFVTSKPIGKGTGLGLSISHQVVHQTHRGRLWFESQQGKGTAFYIEIPMHQEQQDQQDQEDQQDQQDQDVTSPVTQTVGVLN